MESWLEIAVRQLLLYGLPVLVSLSSVNAVERRLTGKEIAGPWQAIVWRGAWWPLLASIAFHRGIIIAMPRPAGHGTRAAAIRLSAHAALCLLGLLLYIWSIASQSPVGMPPLHFWWSKLLMFFNLCMVCLHLLPLPGLLAGELLAGSKLGAPLAARISEGSVPLIVTLLAASPLLDILLGAQLIFPIYENLNNLAASFSGSR